jgi:hypothetical protein
MTRNRKADLQRKLSMAPVATPPADLAERIKREIPPQLGVHPRSSRMLNLRIAASIVLLASSAYLMIHVLSPAGELRKQPAAQTPQQMVAPGRTLVLPETPPEPGSARVQQPADLPSLPKMPPPASMGAVRSSARMAEAKKEEAAGMANGAPSYVDTVETAPAKSDTMAIVNAAPAALAPPPPPVAVAETASPQAAAERIVVKASRDDAPPVRNFVAIQQAIARGEAPRDVDTFAIVQHFARPERVPARLRLELEASAMPLDATKWLLRVSVDGAAVSGVSIDLSFGDAVTSHRAVTGSPAANETALYEIEIKPDAQPDQPIATLRAAKSEATVRVADLHTWNTASPRMKRASLAAAWARTLQSGAQADTIVAKARAAHIDELADMAERAERIR